MDERAPQQHMMILTIAFLKGPPLRTDKSVPWTLHQDMEMRRDAAERAWK